MTGGFSVKVGLHQGSVLLLFLFAIVINASCLLFEIVDVDDLFLMADSMKELWDEICLFVY